MRKASTLERRGAPRRLPKKKIVIVCEGKLTEPRYFQDFLTLQNSTLVSVQTIGGCGVPVSVVERAVSEREALLATARRTRDSFDAAFEVWAVFDRDAHPHTQVPDAFALAAENEIKVAYSNPCFEVWGLMHFALWAKPGHHHETQRDLKERLDGYCHTNNPLMNVVLLDRKYPDAVRNAQMASTRREEEGSSIYGDPSTSVYLLTERIRMNGKD
jgi:hypothetical protein